MEDVKHLEFKIENSSVDNRHQSENQTIVGETEDTEGFVCRRIPIP